MNAEQLFQMLKETDDPEIRQQIAGEFPADPELKGVFERSYQGYLQAVGEERKKPKLPFRMSHGIAIAACMVLVVGAYLAMRIPQERIPSIPEEPTTETIGMTLESIPETSGEPAGTAQTDILPTDMTAAETHASSDMTESAGSNPESVTLPPMTDPVESTAETSVTGDMPEETGTIASSEETAASIATTTAGAITAATTRRTTESTIEPTIAPTEAPTIEPTDETIEPTAEDEGITTPETTRMQTTTVMEEAETQEPTEPTAEDPTEQPETTGMMTTEYTENPTGDTTTTTTTTTTADYETLPGYAVTVRGTLTTVTYCNPVAASPAEMGEYTLDAEQFSIRFQGTKGTFGNPYNSYAVVDPNHRSMFFYQYKRTEFRRNFTNVLSMSPDTVNGHPAYWVITKGSSPDNPDHTLVWDDGLYTFVVTKEAQYSGYLHEAAEAFCLL